MVEPTKPRFVARRREFLTAVVRSLPAYGWFEVVFMYYRIFSKG